VSDESQPGAVRCFYLTIRFDDRGIERCEAPVCWHGVIRTVDGATFRVLSCDTHATTIEGREQLTEAVGRRN
jgi:hypothetical protein